MEEQNLDTINRCIYNKLKKESKNGIIERKEALIILGCIYHIPKNERNNLIKDLESKGIIEIVNQIKIKIN